LADGAAAPRGHQSIPKLALRRARHRRVLLRPRAWQRFISIPGEAILDRDVIAGYCALAASRADATSFA